MLLTSLVLKILKIVTSLKGGKRLASIAQLLDESFSLPPEDPFEETEGSVEISWKGHVTILSILDDDSEEQEDFFLLL